MLKAAVVGSKKHLELIRAGYETHHLDGRVVYMTAPKGKL